MNLKIHPFNFRLSVRSHESDKKKTKEKNSLNIRTPPRMEPKSNKNTKRNQKKIKKKLQEHKNKLKKEEERDGDTSTIEEEEDNIILFEDDDVLREKRLIKGMRPNDLNKRSLVVDQLTKYYGGYLAVDAVSFQVKK